MNYYYADSDNLAVGPCTTEHIQQLYRQGVLHENSWLIEEGAEKWKSYDSLFPPAIDDRQNSTGRMYSSIYSQIVEAALKSHCGKADLFLHGSIPSKMEANGRAACGLKSNEPLLALVNCTIFGSAKNCLLFTPDAIYVHNSSMPRGMSHIMIPYGEFTTRQFAAVPGTKQINLGNNQVLVAENCSTPVCTLLAILWQIKNGIMGNSPIGAHGITDAESDESASMSVGRNCPICKNSRIEDEISEKGGTTGAVVGGLLFGGMGSALGRSATTERVVQNHCLTCHHKWTD